MGLERLPPVARTFPSTGAGSGGRSAELPFPSGEAPSPSCPAGSLPWPVRPVSPEAPQFHSSAPQGPAPGSSGDGGNPGSVPSARPSSSPPGPPPSARTPMGTGLLLPRAFVPAVPSDPVALTHFRTLLKWTYKEPPDWAAHPPHPSMLLRSRCPIQPGTQGNVAFHRLL